MNGPLLSPSAGNTSLTSSSSQTSTTSDCTPSKASYRSRQQCDGRNSRVRIYLSPPTRRVFSRVHLGEPKFVERVLEVEKGQLCYIIGTVYLEMPMKPNILEDIARDHSMPAPPRPDKIYSPEDSTFLEDESGRIRIIGDPVKNVTLVTGLIISALGMESDSGDFEVLDLCFCGLAPQPTLMNPDDKMEVDGGRMTLPPPQSFF
jgi:DNA polymerase delta subunit 2